MKNLKLIVLLALVFIGSNLQAQNALVYEANLSEKKKATKPKQLEGMNGEVHEVLIVSQNDFKIDLDIELEGYAGKYLKVFALSKSGSRKLEIPPDVQKIRAGKTKVSADLELPGTNPSATDYIELVFTNGMLRFKGVSYVYKFKKQWTPKDESTEGPDVTSNPINRPSQIVEVQLVPRGKTREEFINQ